MHVYNNVLNAAFSHTNSNGSSFLLLCALTFTVMTFRCRSLSLLIVAPPFVISTLLITLSNFTFCTSYLISRLFDYSPFGAASLLPGSIAGCKRCKKVDVSELVNIWLELQREAPCEQWCYFCSRAQRQNLCCNARILIQAKNTFYSKAIPFFPFQISTVSLPLQVISISPMCRFKQQPFNDCILF